MKVHNPIHVCLKAGTSYSEAIEVVANAVSRNSAAICDISKIVKSHNSQLVLLGLCSVGIAFLVKKIAEETTKMQNEIDEMHKEINELKDYKYLWNAIMKIQKENNESKGATKE